MFRRHRRRTYLGGSLIILALALVLTPVGAAVSTISFSADEPDAIVEPDQAALEGSVDQATPTPDLAAADRTRALSLLADDPTAQRILAGRSYAVAEMGPWTESDGGPERLVGVTLRVRFDAPQDFPMTDWPQIGYDSVSGTGHYTQSIVPLQASKVTEVQVDIDLSKGAVVGMGPRGDDAAITPGPGAPGLVPPLEPGY